MSDESVENLAGGVTAPRGFRAAGIAAGIKTAGRPDLALLVSDAPAVAAGTFTTNRVQAAPVHLCRRNLATGEARAIVVNSGYANACTGPDGMRDAERMAAVTAELLAVPEAAVFVCSTGTIGVALPMDRIEAGIRQAAGALSPEGGADASRAIMTTDTRPKSVAVQVRVGDRDVRVGGMAKGAGMIDPHMATMLAFLTTDAPVGASALQACLTDAVERSFNRISVDGDQSTNDTVLMLANGCAGGKELTEEHPDWLVFKGAVCEVAMTLALAIVDDGEGATKRVTVEVSGAVDAPDADRVARAIAGSLLVKTSWFGGDPNWGRVIAAVGYAGAAVEPERIAIAFDGLPVVREGRRLESCTLEELEAVYRQPAFTVHVELGMGNASAVLYTCDCSEDYVRINADYMT